jgi:hypothetical protein
MFMFRDIQLSRLCGIPTRDRLQFFANCILVVRTQRMVKNEKLAHYLKNQAAQTPENNNNKLSLKILLKKQHEKVTTLPKDTIRKH